MRWQLWLRETAVLLAFGCAVTAIVLTAVAILASDLANGVTIGGGVLAVVVGAALLRQPSLPRTARAADRHAQLENRLGTAIEILEGRMRGELAALQLGDTWRACAAATPSRVFPALGRDLRLALAAAVLASATATLAIPNADDLRSWFAALLTSSEVSRETVIAPNSSSPSEQAMSALEPSTVGAAPTTLDANAALTSARLRDALQAQDAQSRALEQAVSRLADALRSTAAAQDVGASLERGDVEKAANQLRDLARESDQLSAAARQELARTLLQVSKDSSTLDQTLAAVEQQAARALGRGDYDSGRKALEALAATLVSEQRAAIPSPEVAQALQRLQEQDITRAGNAAACGGGDEYAPPVDCSAGALYSTGEMRASAPTSDVPSPMAGQGEVGRGGGYATSGGDTSTGSLDAQVTRLAVPTDNLVQVDLTPSSAQGGGRSPDPKAASTVITQIGQKDVALSGVAQSDQPGAERAESTFVPPGQLEVVRDFFQPARAQR